ncbi:hypothetical protein FAI40_08100 [Acetobacteraceae bacterium]|nr:hypothetical protein FAI40_08100 [Acetobacteraceae bacterium]
MVSNKCDMQGYTLEQWEDLHTGSGVSAEAYKDPKLTQEELWGDGENTPFRVPDEHLKEYFKFKEGAFNDPEHTPLHRPLWDLNDAGTPNSGQLSSALSTSYYTNFDATIMADPNTKTLWLAKEGK